MKRSLAHLQAAVLAAAAVALVAGAAPAQALDSCSAATPCLPLNDGFSSLLPAGQSASFFVEDFLPAVFGRNNNSASGLEFTSGVLGEYGGAGRGSGVVGTALPESTGADSYGVFGRLRAPDPGAWSAGVRGESFATGSAGIGVLGLQRGSGFGMLGFTPSGFGVAGAGGQAGVLGFATPPGLAGLFLGNLDVQGTLSKSAGAFRIDHPLDPANKYLQHSFVESPQMKNVYDGVLRTDRQGFATVRLPRYFGALNRDFRYQLTVHGRSFAQALVWREIANNRFTIRTNRPGVKVSWQVTGIRRDVYANAHRIQPEVAKAADEQGRYLHPELYGKPRSQSVVPVPAAVRQAHADQG
jgi:hypothetical protein